MNCPNCGQPLPSTSMTTCPSCGQAMPAMSSALPTSNVTPTNEMPPPTPDMPMTSTNVVPPAYPYPYAQYPYPYPAGSYAAPPAAPPTRKWTPWIIGGSIAVTLLLIVTGIVGAIAIGQSRHVTSVITLSSGKSSVSYTTLFKDPMTSPTNHWSNDTHCFFGAGGYHSKGYFCFAPIGAITNGIISEDATQIAGPTNIYHGIVFRRTSVGNEYVFNLGSDGNWHFGKYSNSKFTEIIPYAPNPAIHSGLNVANSLKVIMNGSSFLFFINGVQVGQANDTTYLTGKCGVATSTGSETVFTNFEVDLLNE